MKNLIVDGKGVIINVDSECQAVADFVAPRWGVSSAQLLPLVVQIRERAHEIWRSWIEEHEPYFALRRLEQRRCDMLLSGELSPRARGIASFYDSISHQTSRMGFGLRALCNAGLCLGNPNASWDFSKQADGLSSSIRKNFPWVSDLKPSGWDDLAKNYDDFDGMQEWDKKGEDALFDGHCSDGVRSDGLVGSLSLPSVMYNHFGQGRNPTRSLVSGIFSHFLFVFSHNNSAEITNELDSIALEEFSCEIAFDKKIAFNSKLLQALDGASAKIEEGNEGHYSKEAYERAQEPLKQNKSKGPGSVGADEVSRIIREIIAEENDDELGQLEAKERTVYREHLLAALGPAEDKKAVVEKAVFAMGF